MVNVTAIIGLAAMLAGEGPHWVEEDQSLLMVDIPSCYVYRYFPETERVQKLKLSEYNFIVHRLRILHRKCCIESI